ncbi:MAG: T9SS type A sorting domain-containing protein [Flavobacteriales bacterium]|nr:T9SS type A sorting domain-containing protein [Flavobacteriales bacterium]
MRKKYALLMLTLAAGLSSTAQITITAAENLPAIGDAFTYHKAAYAPPPAGGADVLFDHASLTSTGTVGFDWIDPALYSGVLSAATIAVASGPDTVVYSVTAQGLERIGEWKRLNVMGQQLDLAIAYSTPRLDLKLPLTYGNTWSGQPLGTVVSNGSTGPSTGVYTGSADAYGRIMLPGIDDPLGVLRVHTYLQETVNIPILGTPTDVSHRHRQYDYYVDWQQMPVLSIYTDTLSALISGFPITVADNGIRYMPSEQVGIAEQAPFAPGIWPNPAEGLVNVDMARPVTEGGIIRVMDIGGRQVRSERLPQGAQRWQLSTDALPAGCYTVTVADERGTHGTARLIRR